MTSHKQNSEKEESRFTPELLRDIYFTPKTYDELEAAQKRTERVQGEHRRKHIARNGALASTFLLFIPLFLLTNMEQLWFTGAIPIIVLYFGGFIITFFLIPYFVRYISDALYSIDSTPRKFFVPYSIITALFISVTLSGWVGRFHTIPQILCITLIHSAITFSLLVIAVKQAQGNN